jgi:hypothetical protein
MCSKIAKLAFLDMRQTLVGSLQIDSEILERIQSDFVKMIFTGDFSIHSFQEGRPINQTVGKVNFFIICYPKYSRYDINNQY